jgi:cation transport protein ChaC
MMSPIHDPREVRDLRDELLDPMPQQILALRNGMKPVWIFAYGSLIWDPEFSSIEAEVAWLSGYHRSFCLYSYDYRGSPARPGLVLGLDRGGSCQGVVFCLPPDSLAASIDRLWVREMSGRRVYQMRLLTVRTAQAARKALTFTVRRDCPDYAGRLELDEAARMILGAEGRRGTCRDYFENTLRHLEQRSIIDRPLRRLAQRIEVLAALQGRHGEF